MKRKVVNKFKGNAKKALLQWVQCTAAKYVTLKIIIMIYIISERFVYAKSAK